MAGATRFFTLLEIDFSGVKDPIRQRVRQFQQHAVDPIFAHRCFHRGPQDMILSFPQIQGDKHGSAGFPGFEHQLSAVGLNDPAGQRQSESHAPAGIRDRVPMLAAGEDQSHLIRRDPAALIPDRDLRPLALPPQADADLLARLGKFDGIGKQVGNQ